MECPSRGAGDERSPCRNHLSCTAFPPEPLQSGRTPTMHHLHNARNTHDLKLTRLALVRLAEALRIRERPNDAPFAWRVCIK